MVKQWMARVVEQICFSYCLLTKGFFDNDALLSFYNYDSLGHDNVCPRYYPSWL